MEKVEIQNLARPRVRYGHVTDTQEAKTSCCSLPHAEHWKMGQKKKKKGGVKKVLWNGIIYTHTAQISPASSSAASQGEGAHTQEQ